MDDEFEDDVTEDGDLPPDDTAPDTTEKELEAETNAILEDLASDEPPRSQSDLDSLNQGIIDDMAETPAAPPAAAQVENIPNRARRVGAPAGRFQVPKAERTPQTRQASRQAAPDFAAQKADDIDDFNNDGGLGGEDDDGGGGKDAPDVMDLGGRVVESMSNAIADLRRRLEAVESALERERL